LENYIPKGGVIIVILPESVKILSSPFVNKENGKTLWKSDLGDKIKP